MLILFFIPLTFIALFETHLDASTNVFMKNMLGSIEDGEEDNPNYQNPTVAGEEDGLEISKIPFDQLTAVFPNAYQVSLLDPRLRLN